MNVVHVCGRGVVDVSVKFGDTDCVPKVRHQSRDIVEKLFLRLGSARCIEKIKCPIVSRIIREHIQTGAAEVGLGTAVCMQNVIVFLSSAIRVREVDQPIAPTVRIIDREWADERRAPFKCVKHDPLVSGRINDWVKVTCRQRETLPIAGFALKENRFDGLYVGRLKGKELIYAGKVDHGFDSASAKDLQARLKPLVRKTQPYSKKIAHRGVWVEPSLLAEIEYRAKSAEGKLRHPFFKGIRDDL
jgi:ATP dependent DNA ligase C terminal region